MGFLTKNKEQKQELSQRQILETKYRNARSNLLVVLAFTIVNIILSVANANTYFLFSAYVPYMLADLGMMLCGMYPQEYYGEELAGIEFLDKGFLAVMLAIAGVILVLYLLSWIFSKKNRRGWMIFALVLFAIDTALLLLMNGIVLDMILDYVFHGWVIASLISGIVSVGKLKKLPEDAGCFEQVTDNSDGASLLPEE